jgi:uncharacterized protein (TIGR02453 family)
MATGIPADAFDFFEELAADNTKTWWTANKERYQASVRGPVDDLLASLSDEFGAPKVFRPYRDTRFAKDKTPYKTNLGATLTGSDGSVHYLALSADGLFLGGGYYQLQKDQLARFRAAVVDDATGAELASIVAALEKARYELGGEHLKRVPPAFDKDHPRARFLRHKGLYAGIHHDPAAWMGTKKAAERVASAWRAMGPLHAWLHAHVGPSRA